MRRLTCQLDFKFFDDLRRDFVLNGENIDEIAIVGLRPQVPVRSAFNQLRCNPDPVAGLANRSLEHIANIQGISDLGNVYFLTAIRKRRRPRDHAQLFYLGEQVQELLGDTVREVLLLGIGTHVDEWQDGDGLVDLQLDGRSQPELVRGEIADGQKQHDDDRPVHPTRSQGRHGLARIASDALGSPLEYPSKDGGRDDTNNDDVDQCCHGLVGEAVGGQHEVGNLQKQPRSGQVGQHHPDDTPTLELVDQRHLEIPRANPCAE